MRIKVEQLEASLEQRGLAPIYCISGDEPLQLLEAVDLIRRYAREHGVAERIVLEVDKDFDWNSLAAAGANLSLFSRRRLIELRLGDQKPGREGGAALTEYAAAPDPDDVLLITAAKFDKKTQQSGWFKGLDSAGVMIQIWPVEPARLPDWIRQRAGRHGKTLQRDAAALIAQKVEGNLLAARQEVEKLHLLIPGPEITLEHVMDAVSDSARYDTFALVETACLGDIEHTARMLRGLRIEGAEPLSVFGALLWELRRVYAMVCAQESGAAREHIFAEYRVWPQRRAALNKILSRLRAPQAAALIAEAARVDRFLKGALRGDPWVSLEKLLFRLAGAG
jgi:DNA polymerase-3 subunit delta